MPTNLNTDAPACQQDKRVPLLLAQDIHQHPHSTKTMVPTHAPILSTMHLASMKVFAIPELLECIAQVLETKDQLHLSKVNRLCYQAVSPLLWSALDLSEKTRAERLFESTHHHDGLCRNFHRVRHLKIQTDALLHFVDSMTQFQCDDILMIAGPKRPT
jgi:hypothetical protein